MELCEAGLFPEGLNAKCCVTPDCHADVPEFDLASLSSAEGAAGLRKAFWIKNSCVSNAGICWLYAIALVFNFGFYYSILRGGRTKKSCVLKVEICWLNAIAVIVFESGFPAWILRGGMTKKAVYNKQVSLFKQKKL